MTDKSVIFEVGGQQVSLNLPPPGVDATHRSVFLLGLPKAGSTLLNRIMRPLTEAAGLSWFSIQETLRGIGLKPAAYPAKVNELYAPSGYAFGGYRSLPGALTLPAFASDRTVLLVRDPRDMLTSLYFSVSVSHAPPGTTLGTEMKQEFQRRREETGRMSIDSFVLDNLHTTLGQFGQLRRKMAGIGHKTWRYEDVIFDKANWVAEMLSYLDLDVAQNIVSREIEKNDVRPTSEDSSAHIRRVAPGDHREKLEIATIEKLNHELGPILREFNYI